MNDSHPLGDITGDTVDITDGTGQVVRTDPAQPDASSIVDTLLDLDALLSADVRRAEKTFRFCTRPDLEAKMEDLQAELESLVDINGRPKKSVDASMADGSRSATQVSLDIEALEDEYAAAMRVGRVTQMDEDDWAAFTTQWKSVLSDMPPYPPTFYEALIVRSKAALVVDGSGRLGSPFTVEQVRTFRKKFGHPAFNAISDAAWRVNNESGVSVPKSALSSAVLRLTEQD